MRGPYDNNFTVYKIYPNRADGPRSENKVAVLEWINSMNQDWLHEVGYKIRYDSGQGCYRLMVNEAKVRDTGYTQLLWLKHRKNVGYVYLPPTKR